MRLIVGLGNPGAQHAGHRHNIGFMAVDRIAADHGFGPWRSKFRAQIAEGRLGGDKALLVKPQTFMNLSGQSVSEAMRFYKLDPAEVIVVHDELDLAPGKCRVKHGGGHAGHNGLRSIHGAIGPDYVRVRLGIGHPGHKDRVSGYVLHGFAKADAGWLDDLLRGVSDGADALAAGDHAKFLNAVSLRTAPPRSGGVGRGGKAGAGGTAPAGGKARARETPGDHDARPETGRETGPETRPGAGSDYGSAAPGGPETGGAAKRGPETANPQSDGSGPARGTGDPPADTRSALEKLIDRFR